MTRLEIIVKASKFDWLIKSSLPEDLAEEIFNSTHIDVTVEELTKVLKACKLGGLYRLLTTANYNVCKAVELYIINNIK